MTECNVCDRILSEDWIMLESVTGLFKEMFLRTKKHITYDENKREKAKQRQFSVREKYVKELSENGIASDITKYLCDVLADDYYEFACWVRGIYEFDKKRILTKDKNGQKRVTICQKFDAKCASISIKNLLEDGYDTKVLYYPVYKDDDYDEYARLVYRQGIRNGVTVMPYFCEMDNRPKGEKLVDYVFLDVVKDRWQFTSLGEIAVLQSYDTTEDVIAMLCRANTDFSHVEKKGDKPVHSFTYLMRDETFVDESYKDKMIDIFEKVYLNSENGLSEKQRKRILKAMCDCLNPKMAISNEICEKTKEKITKSLTKMMGINKETCVDKTLI